MAQFKSIVQKLRCSFENGYTKELRYRLEQLHSLHRLLLEHEEEFIDSLYEDLRRPKHDAQNEMLSIRVEIADTIRNLQRWMKPKRSPRNMLIPFDEAYVQFEPYGVILVLGAWNYPVYLAFLPLIGIIAAGNCALVKPSEVTSSTSALIARLFPEYLDERCYSVVECGVDETIGLLTNKFDYIFCTSSTKVGKAVYKAAANHLTPVTLELGGKSPVYIDESANVDLAAKRILWGKITNAGQTCVAPDYILCSKKIEKLFVQRFQHHLQQIYGNDIQNNPKIGRIVNKNHFYRLHSLLTNTKGTIAFGGQHDITDLWITPTIIVDVTEDDALMQDEIFGPILPIISVTSADEAIQFIKSRTSKPLAIYAFSKKREVQKLILKETSSGSVCINDVVLQCNTPGLPFGGVGDSGIGRYHGCYSFETFSHFKSVLVRDFSDFSEKALFFRYANAKVHRDFLETMIKKVYWFYVPNFKDVLILFLLSVIFYAWSHKYF